MLHFESDIFFTIFRRPDGTKLKLPDCLLGQLGNDPKKKTLLVYGHLDGQLASQLDCVTA
jgi:hypothetical protein